MFYVTSFLVLGLSLKASCFLEDYTPSPENEVEIISFIDILNNRDHESVRDRKKSRYLEESTQRSNKANNKIQDLIQVLQKNYDIAESDARLHYISNPEVIDEYKTYIDGKKRLKPDLYYNDDNEEKTLKEILQILRRNAVFRLNKREGRAGNAVALRIGSVSEDVKNKRKDRKDDEYRINEDISNDKLKQDSDFDVKDTITKKYNWADSLETKKDKKRNRHIKIEKDEDVTVPKPRKRLKFKPKIVQEPFKKIRKDSVFSFGRTSIPFVGKHGIYEDK